VFAFRHAVAPTNSCQSYRHIRLTAARREAFTVTAVGNRSITVIWRNQNHAGTNKKRRQTLPGCCVRAAGNINHRRRRVQRNNCDKTTAAATHFGLSAKVKKNTKRKQILLTEVALQQKVFTARCYASAVQAMTLCPSVRPSQVSVLLKRLNVGSHNNTTR